MCKKEEVDGKKKKEKKKRKEKIAIAGKAGRDDVVEVGG